MHLSLSSLWWNFWWLYFYCKVRSSVWLRFLSGGMEYAPCSLTGSQTPMWAKTLNSLYKQVTKPWLFQQNVKLPGSPRQTWWPGTVFHHPVAFSVFSSRLHLLAVLVITWGSVPAEWAPRTSWRCSLWIPSPYSRPWTRCNRVRSRSPRGSWGRRQESRRSWTCHLLTLLRQEWQRVCNIRWWVNDSEISFPTFSLVRDTAQLTSL